MVLATMSALAANEWLAGLADRIEECKRQDLPYHEIEFMRDSIAWQLTDRNRYTLNAKGELAVNLDPQTGF